MRLLPLQVTVTEPEDGVNIYKTRMLPCLTRTGAERVAAAEAVFFGRVDHQMNKIEAFYIDQERQCTQRADSLYRQLEALLEMKKALTVQEHTSAQRLQEEEAQEEVKVQEEQGAESILHISVKQPPVLEPCTCIHGQLCIPQMQMSAQN